MIQIGIRDEQIISRLSKKKKFNFSTTFKVMDCIDFTFIVLFIDFRICNTFSVM